MVSIKIVDIIFYILYNINFNIFFKKKLIKKNYIQKFYIYFLIKYISFYILKFEKKIMGNELMINNIRLKMAIID